MGLNYISNLHPEQNVYDQHKGRRAGKMEPLKSGDRVQLKNGLEAVIESTTEHGMYVLEGHPGVAFSRRDLTGV